MLEVEDRFMIKDLHRKGISIGDIARQTGHDRKTVRHALDEPLVPPSQPGQSVHYRLGPYIEYLNKRIAEGVLNASKLYDEIKEQGYEGSHSQLRAFVHPFRTMQQPQATVRFETEPGDDGRADGPDDTDRPGDHNNPGRQGPHPRRAPRQDMRGIFHARRDNLPRTCNRQQTGCRRESKEIY